MSKVVLVTGASSGIGKSIATYLHEKGYKVFGTSRNPKNTENFSFQMIALDVLKVETIETAVAFIIKKEGRLDVLINNAGMGITGPIEDTPTDEMRAVFNTNLFGAIDVMKAVLPQMRLQKHGMILNVTSIAGYMGLPFRGLYSATKGALELVTESISMEVKSFGINVVNIAPGDFATNIAAGRYHTPIFENSAYKENYRANLDLMDSHVNGGMNPLEMAKAVYDVINTKKPNIHYKVGGFMEKFSIVLKRVLPDKMYQKILMNHYKL
ncbi:SDR family oxidoreductase [Polaribacter glomeratus]|uniref:Short-chain dehydrogenase/reductase n=1 Tax=Polaribacter glomeratus TaxID=102 RepID=A0A2S7WVN3_9FLAO|nr:SDR family oxidoreductase [Polaribacter glomeratus]PQJ81431.1 short-chain dehydrogenase/reductase [Polaribacter glomeratus]TXD64768.1 SDR family oxidoreductase [Polaribacter glomeratus]